MKRACVIGWPIAHSLSPLIHGYWLQKYGVGGDYIKVPVEPENLEAFLKGLAKAGFCGANVTVPHKVEAYHLCDERDRAANAIGAVNTIWLDGGKLCGANTDASGFLANLDSKARGWDRAGVAAVIGAGGAARAIVWALSERGFDNIRVINRTKARTDALCRLFRQVTPFGFDAASRALREASVVVNCSSLGMAGCDELEIDLSPLARHATVCDIVYNPLETALLRQARKRGFIAVDGLGMLLFQAVPGFEKWFGVRPEVTDELRRAVLAAIADAKSGGS